MKADFIGDVLRRVADRTAEQDDRMLGRLDRRLHRADGDGVRYTEMRAASQALLTGAAARALSAGEDTAAYATWGSWVEGVPFAHALMLNEGLIVDLIPCRTEAAFVQTYRCLPRQFLDCLYRMQGSGRAMYFNFRDYDADHPETADRYRDQADAVRDIYEHFADVDYANCYLNSMRSKSLLAIFDPGGVMDRHEAELGGTGAAASETGLLAQLSEALGGARDYEIRAQFQNVLVRGKGRLAQVPKPIQIFKRTVYHLAFSEICADIPADPLIHVLARRVRDHEQIGFVELMALSARATELHHAYTAPLTGAYGGTYNLTEAEVAPGFKPPRGDARDEQNRGFLEFMYGAMSYRIKEDHGQLKAIRDVSGAITLTQRGQAPTDEELREFLDFLPDSRSFLRKREILETALRESIRRSDGDFDSVESYISEAEKAFRTVNGLWAQVKRGTFVGGGMAVAGGAGAVGIGVMATSLGMIDALFSSAVAHFGPVSDRAADTVFGNLYDRFVDRKSDNKQIVRIIEDLRG